MLQKLLNKGKTHPTNQKAENCVYKATVLCLVLTVSPLSSCHTPRAPRAGGSLCCYTAIKSWFVNSEQRPSSEELHVQSVQSS